MSRRRPMQRIGELIPDAAARLGVADELRLARAMSTFDSIVAEHAPAAHGACRALRIDGSVLVDSLAEAFRAAPAGASITELRVTVRRG